MSKNLKIWAVRAALLVLPFMAMAGDLTSALGKGKGILNLIIEILFIVVTAYFMYGVIVYIMSAGNEEKLAEGRQHMLWGLIGMAAMAAAWGISNMLITSFDVTKEKIPTKVGE